MCASGKENDAKGSLSSAQLERPGHEEAADGGCQGERPGRGATTHLGSRGQENGCHHQGAEELREMQRAPCEPRAAWSSQSATCLKTLLSFSCEISTAATCGVLVRTEHLQLHQGPLTIRPSVWLPGAAIISTTNRGLQARHIFLSRFWRPEVRDPGAGRPPLH